jgi:flagellar biosynthesis anti-sigma factor FlgM
MVRPIASSGTAPIDTPKISKVDHTLGSLRRDKINGDDALPAVRLARLGPPIDINHVDQIRAAIAKGSYTVDADRLAAAMLALDMPVRQA